MPDKIYDDISNIEAEQNFILIRTDTGKEFIFRPLALQKALESWSRSVASNPAARLVSTLNVSYGDACGDHCKIVHPLFKGGMPREDCNSCGSTDWKPKKPE